ncbi:MAG: DUF1499 domain-containing protein [Pseudomonadota bacterium]
MRIFLIVLLTVLIGVGLYVRLAPSDPARWHAMPDEMDNIDMDGGAKRVIDAGDGDLARLHAIALSTPRTQALAGSVEARMITYITRSRVFGFPDYTTVTQEGAQIKIHARLRFGRLDMGVNAARVDAWLAQLSGSGG